MKISLCNEVLRDFDFRQQCVFARDLGFDGLEIAPFTLAENPCELKESTIREFRKIAEDNGVRITGLHWLLITPEGLSITSPDQSIRRKTLDIIRCLVDLCAGLGGSVLIHGSPKQRMIGDNDNRQSAEQRAVELFSRVADEAAAAGVTYCIEPLTQKETNFINTLEEAVQLVRIIDKPSFRTMLDTKAARGAEKDPIPLLIERWVPTRVVAHVHLNDRNLRAPGQGDDQFTPVLKALLENHYSGILAVEPFDYFPNGLCSAARSIGYLRGILEAIS
jgi:sugar phosphate isomerase/epimerase